MFRVKEPDAATVLRPGSGAFIGAAAFGAIVAYVCFPAVGDAITNGGDVRTEISVGLIGAVLVAGAIRSAFRRVKFSGEVIAWTATFRDLTANRSDVLGFELVALRGRARGQATIQMHLVGRNPVNLPVSRPNNAHGAAELHRMQALLEAWRVGP